MKPHWLLMILLTILPRLAQAQAQPQEQYIQDHPTPNAFPLAEKTIAATIYVDPADFPGVLRAAADLRDDIQRVTSLKPTLTQDLAKLTAPPIIIGSLGHSPTLDRLDQAGKIDLAPLRGKWESFFLQVVNNPLPGIPAALIIAGSDKRGAIYGIYDLSQQIGVSPWYGWADVPTPHRDALYVKPGLFLQGEPSVKYRGIFLNDEAPDLSNWVAANYGTVPGLNDVPNYNAKFYARIFETILRMKGNYLWPAMWNNAFNEDDPENPKLADEYGIVMGTSHQEPMLRAQKEWDRGPGLQNGNWNYNNPQQQSILQDFWRQGVRRNKNYENIYTLGLRAENDSGQPIGAPLTEQIVAAQRKILAEEINPNLSQIPQLWCLYKEVQGFYDNGLRAPDDVTLLWADDNWANLRRLPTDEERKRPGGAGIYYHLDYHGGPRNYQWINSTPIAKIREQMTQAKEYGADRIWIVNVGHFKGLEFPMQYFLSLAWNTQSPTNQDTELFTRLWAQQQFGEALADPIAGILQTYTRFNARRKPELLDPNTYSQINDNEADRIVADYNALLAKAETIAKQLPPNLQDAFDELVLFPVKVSANLNEMYIAAGRNALYARQNRASTNDWADRTQTLFDQDATLTNYFNQTLAAGKWNHFMDQIHIGYTTWNSPQTNIIPRLQRITPPAASSLAVAIEGSTAAWPGSPDPAILPRFDSLNQQKYWIDIFNRGQAPFDFTATPSDPWITLTPPSGQVQKDTRIWVTIDWTKAPPGKTQAALTITKSAADPIKIALDILKPPEITRESLQGFAEDDHYVSIEAEHFTRQTPAAGMKWDRLPDYGRTLSALASAPIRAASAEPPGAGACLEYRMYLTDSGPATVYAVTAPSLNIDPTRGLRYAIAFDDEKPQLVTLVPKGFSAGNGNAEWENSVRNEARFGHSSHTIAAPGYHTLKIWSIDPNVILEKLVIDLGGFRQSYLGPPESFHH